MYHLNITDKSQVLYVFDRVKPDLVIHCAAVGSVDYAENNFVECHNINVIGTRNVVEATGKGRFIYLSTNAVYKGDNPPYSEMSERVPVNRYGALKREAENLVMALSNNWLIIRPFMLYGYPYPGGRPNWFTTITQKLAIGETVKLVNDVWWQPTMAEDVAKAIWQLVKGDKNQIYNVASDDHMTLYDFGLTVAKHNKVDSNRIEPIATSELKGIASRPVDTAYDLSKVKAMGLKFRGVEEGLKTLK
jgi:dTDP-4-dehydrorhamnose reductase